MSPASIPASLRRRVASQAGHRCGYCHTSEHLTGIPHTVDHLVPLAAGGESTEGNLWLACRVCNEFKGTQTQAPDPETVQSQPLFNPRTQNWRDHFIWDATGTHIVGRTPVGRATVVALRLNRDLAVFARSRWVKAGWHPPEEDLG